MLKKNIMILILIVFTVFTVFGFEKGTKSLGGGFSLSSFKTDDNPTYWNLGIYPRLSYFIWKGVCLELSPSFNYAWNKDDNSHGFGLEAGVRYFFKKFYVGAGLRWETSRTPSADYKSSSRELLLRAGRLFGLAKNIFLDLGLVYTRGLGEINVSCENPDVCGQDWDNDLSMLRAHLGIAVYFK